VTEHFLTDLFERYHRAVYWYCLRQTRRPEDAEDLVQEVFYRVSRSARQYRRQSLGQETVWLFRIARNLLIDKKRKESGLPEGDGPASHVWREATQLLAFSLQEALDRVPAPDREVFVLREIAGLTYAEIAALCEMSEDGVRARLFRVRGQLRELLGGRARSALQGKEGDVRS
jgi:RNA polymerase sigma-70 factor (ECF subfamily)